MSQVTVALHELREEDAPFITGDAIGYHEQRARQAAGHEPDLRTRNERLHELLTEACGLFRWTTEDLVECFRHLDVAGKRCLTVASSGDHIINLLLAGAREVVAFDSVATTGELSWFKMQAMVDLDWRDHEHFRDEIWNEALKPIPYARLLDRVTMPPFDYDWSVLKNAIHALETPRMVLNRFQTIGTNPYLKDETSFQAAREACRQALDDGRVSFVHADVRELPLLDLGEFDLILLSNILGEKWNTMVGPYGISRRDRYYAPATKMPPTPGRLKALVDQMIWPVAGMLAPGGTMVANYTYGCPDAEFEEVLRASAAEDGKEYEPDPLESGLLRRAAFAPLPGFAVEERSWQTVNDYLSGNDVAVLVRRKA